MAGSRWVKLDVDYPTNPKIYPLTNAAFRLHVAMIAHCARELTDGHLTHLDVKLCSHRAHISTTTTTRCMSQLTTAGLIEPCENGYMLHDFLTMNPQLERTVVEARRKKWRTAKHGDDDTFP